MPQTQSAPMQPQMSFEDLHKQLALQADMMMPETPVLPAPPSPTPRLEVDWAKKREELNSSLTRLANAGMTNRRTYGNSVLTSPLDEVSSEDEINGLLKK